MTMRKDDHQIVTEYFVGVFAKGVKYDSEKTGLGWERRRPCWPRSSTSPTHAR